MIEKKDSIFDFMALQKSVFDFHCEAYNTHRLNIKLTLSWRNNVLESGFLCL